MNINFLTQNLTQKAGQRPLITRFSSNPITFLGKKEDSFEPSKPKAKRRTKAEMAEAKYREESLVYQEKLQYNPKIAFLYNPDVSPYERYQAAIKTDEICTVGKLAKKLNVSSEALFVWQAAGLIDIEDVSAFNHYGAQYYIDPEFSKNKEFLDSIKDGIKTSVSAYELINRDRISGNVLQYRMEKGELKPLGLSEKPKGCSIDGVYFDLSDEVNNKTITGLRRITPHASEKYFKPAGHTMVPVGYLQKLGYGDARVLANMVKKGILPGKFEPVPKKEGEKQKYRVYVDTEPYIASEEKLTDLRKRNPNTVSVSQFAKELNITQKAVKEAISDGECDAINEYIFSSDTALLIDKTTPKNAEFIDKKLFELRIIEEALKEKRAEAKKAQRQRAKDPIQSLRMEIVWSMCQKTEMAAGLEAKRDGHAGKIVAKKASGETLTDEEDIKYRAYCKAFWRNAGVEEFSRAHRMADKIMDQFKAGGIDAVEDPKAKKIIEDFLKSHEN